MKFATPISAVCVVTILLASCQQPVTDAEAALFVSPQQYAPYGIAVPEDESPYVQVTRTLQPDLSTQLQYVYQPQDDSDITYMTQEVRNSLTPLEGIVADLINDFVRSTVYESSGLKVLKTDEYPYNDHTRTFAIVNKEGGVVGNILEVGWGNLRYSATVVGVSISNAEVWEEVFGENLAAIAAHQW